MRARGSLIVSCCAALALLWARVSAQSGTTWRQVATNIREAITVVSVDGTGGVWLLTDGAVAHHREPTGNWSTPVAVPGGPLGSMLATGGGVLIGVRQRPSDIVALRGREWSTLGVLRGCIEPSVSLSAIGETVAAGCAYYPGLVFWRTTTPTRFEEQTPPINIEALALVAEDDALVLEFDQLSRVKRNAATPVVIKTGTTGYSLLWASDRDIVMADRDGRFSHASWDRVTGVAGPWTDRAFPEAVSIAALWGRSATDLYAVGRAGVILHFDGAAWHRQPAPTSADLATVAGNASSVWVGGADGTLMTLAGRGP